MNGERFTDWNPFFKPAFLIRNDPELVNCPTNVTFYIIAKRPPKTRIHTSGVIPPCIVKEITQNFLQLEES